MHFSFDPPSAVEFTSLYNETGWGDWDEARLGQALANSWVVCCARDDQGQLIGIGRLISDGALHAFVTEMIVSESERGKGVGQEILARLVSESRRRGVDDVQLFAAQGRAAFYERNGFERRADNSPGMRLVLED